MSRDQQHQNLKYNMNQVEHKYGDKVHIVSDPLMLTVLAKLCSQDTKQPLINYYVETLYRYLLKEVVNSIIPRVSKSIPTRMYENYKEAIYEGDIIDPEQKIISVSLARAGIVPSYIVYSALNYVVNPESIRQDHFIANRRTNEKDEVVGVDITGSKIGGGVQDAIILFPDPMGATGGTISHAISHYKEKVEGIPIKLVALHLIITPEYVKRMTRDHPEVEIFALRLDRGLSSQKVLNSIPGTYPGEEVGLDSKQYIVPGGGGLGEILNNAYI